MYANADSIDVAQPAFSPGFKGCVESGVVAPHVADLQQELLVPRNRDQFLKGFERIGRRLLEVQMLAGLQRQLAVSRVVAHR